jgi:hypothetical protein
MSGMDGVGITVLHAPGRTPAKHVTTQRLDKAIEWLMLLRRYQAEGYTFGQAVAQADAAFAPRPPGRKQQKGSLR